VVYTPSDITCPRELRGWWLAVFVWRVRPERPGERAEIMARAKALGLEIKE